MHVWIQNRKKKNATPQFPMYVTRIFFEIFQFITPELRVIPYPIYIGFASVLIIGIDFTTAAQCDGMCCGYWWLDT